MKTRGTGEQQLISDEVCELLTNIAQILDVVKAEWAESWSDFDQQQRDGITKQLKAYYEPSAKEK